MENTREIGKTREDLEKLVESCRAKISKNLEQISKNESNLDLSIDKTWDSNYKFKKRNADLYGRLAKVYEAIGTKKAYHLAGSIYEKEIEYGHEKAAKAYEKAGCRNDAVRCYRLADHVKKCDESDMQSFEDFTQS